MIPCRRLGNIDGKCLAIFALLLAFVAEAFAGKTLAVSIAAVDIEFVVFLGCAAAYAAFASVL